MKIGFCASADHAARAKAAGCDYIELNFTGVARMSEEEFARAAALLEKYKVKPGDLLLIISNSGRNPLIVELAQWAKELGCCVVALTSLKHSLSGTSRHESGKRLCEIADIVLDNLGVPGDACISYEGFAGLAAPTSTVIGAALLQAAAAQAVQCLIDDGITPEVFASSNIDQGDAINEAYLERYKKEILYL